MGNVRTLLYYHVQRCGLVLATRTSRYGFHPQQPHLHPSSALSLPSQLNPSPSLARVPPARDSHPPTPAVAAPSSCQRRGSDLTSPSISIPKDRFACALSHASPKRDSQMALRLPVRVRAATSTSPVLPGGADGAQRCNAAAHTVPAQPAVRCRCAHTAGLVQPAVAQPRPMPLTSLL